MSKWEKRLARLRQNPKHVCFADIETILVGLGFKMRQKGSSHAVFTRDIHRITVPKPHETSFVKEVYITKQLLPLLEEMGLFDEEGPE